MGKDFIKYRDSLVNLCVYSAEIQQFADDIKDGRPVDKRKLAYASTMAKKYREWLLQDKAALGYGDGLAFMEDNKFFGFEILNGRLAGDKGSVLPVVRKWLDGFPDTANHYQYEVSMYCLALVYGEHKGNLYPEDFSAGREELPMAA